MTRMIPCLCRNSIEVVADFNWLCISEARLCVLACKPTNQSDLCSERYVIRMKAFSVPME